MDPVYISRPLTHRSKTWSNQPSQQIESFRPLGSADAYINDHITKGTNQYPGDYRSRRDTRGKFRTYLYGLDQVSSQKQTEEEDNDGRSGLADVARGVRNRLSRTNSLVSQLSSAKGSRASLLLEQSAMPHTEESAHILDQIREKAWADSLAALHHVSSPVDEDMHIDAVVSPIRRRSLLTPGIATRIPNDILRKPPPPARVPSQADRDYYYNPSLSQTSPLSHLAALNLAYDGRYSPVPRASTPCDLDYTHLGGLKLGTLRVTNDTTSPAPYDPSLSFENRQSTSNPKKDEEYITVSEAVKSEDETQAQEGRSVRDEDHPPKPKRASCLKKRRSLSASGRASRLPDRASSMAHEYMSELPCSPFSSHEALNLKSPAMKPKYEGGDVKKGYLENRNIAKPLPDHTGDQNWRSFIADAEARHADNGCMEDAFRTVGHCARPDFEEESRPVSSSTFSDLFGHSCTDSINPLDQVDSGYSSNDSLNSLSTSMASGDSNDRHPRLVVKSLLRASRGPERPREMPHSASVTQVVQTSAADDPALTSRRSLAKQKLISIDRVSALKSSTSSETVTTLDPGYIASTSTSKNIRKLRKARPLSQPIPAEFITVQGCEEFAPYQIPPVPSEISMKHAERLHHFPLLERTFPSLQHTTSKDIVMDEEFAYAPIRFPSPSNAFGQTDVPLGSAVESRSKRLNLKAYSPLASQSDCGPATAAKAHHEAHHQRLRRPSDNSQIMISDFGTVTESLGSSPYDIARPNSIVTASPTAHRNGSHPHQMSTATPRARSMIGMDGEVAAELARARSRLRSCSVSRPKTPYHNDFNDRGGIPGKMVRPRSLIVNAPPIPTLPTLEQLHQKEAQISRSNSEQRKTLTPPRKTKQLLGTLKQQSATADVAINTDEINDRPHETWEVHREAWSQRRKSAGEVLLLRAQATKSSKSSASIDTLSTQAQSTMQLSDANSPSKGLQNLAVRKQATRSFHVPFSGIQCLSNPHTSSTASLQRLSAPESNIERLSGRFEGGLLFGYESGVGLGGSAGTRSLKSGASRKCVDVSLGFGIDLSDIPIFVAPSS
ncbi:hypothetical protein MMC12_007245 [Toensbergia leucococca]|nr:hypothetical protein [Toensbergia leucococca]